jgi:hypothetical protein
MDERFDDHVLREMLGITVARQRDLERLIEDCNVTDNARRRHVLGVHSPEQGRLAIGSLRNTKARCP